MEYMDQIAENYKEAEGVDRPSMPRTESKDAQIALLTEENAALLAQVEQMHRQLRKDEAALLEEERFLQSVKQQMLQLNMKLQQAQRQNRIYEEKLNKIYGTWYGKAALKLYKLLKKVKNLVRKK